MTSCRSSIFLPVTLICSSIICVCTLSFLSFIILVISLAFSEGMPWSIFMVCLFIPPAASSPLPYSSDLRETPLLTSFVWRMSMTLFSLLSSSATMVTSSFFSHFISLLEPLKSYLCCISFIAWFTALSTSCVSVFETMSNDGMNFLPPIHNSYSWLYDSRAPGRGGPEKRIFNGRVQLDVCESHRGLVPEVVRDGRLFHDGVLFIDFEDEVFEACLFLFRRKDGHMVCAFPGGGVSGRLRF